MGQMIPKKSSGPSDMKMKMTDQGIRLIMEFEGFRAQAYRDAVGVWTVGYGHTAAAGKPDVTAGLKITRTEAETILRRDVRMFAEAVAKLVKVPLADNQFSALVSFAFNVGTGNFAKSSVLAAVNRNDFDAVPSRLALWVKAGGRTLPGLIRRRAVEAQMFLQHEAGPVVAAKPDVQNRTIWSSLIAIAIIIFKHLRKSKKEDL